MELSLEVYGNKSVTRFIFIRMNDICLGRFVQCTRRQRVYESEKNETGTINSKILEMFLECSVYSKGEFRSEILPEVPK
jgi:hypothetical protein